MPLMRNNQFHADGRHHKESPTYLLQWRSLGQNSNISGYACSAELFAFLGIDELAKSTILKTIAMGQQDDSNGEVSLRRRSFSGKTSTIGPTVSLNGTAVKCPLNFSLLEVDDSCNVYDCLSVLETLVFSAELRLVSKSSMPHPSELVALRLLTEMGLEDIAETRIGDLPVWQRRLILFATEVIAGRDILFFDRPTSDLDAQSALSVVSALQRVARSGRLVVITAGSLTFREYAILDRIQLLSNRGTGSIFFGPGSSAVAYFARLGRTPSPGASISDFLLDLVDEDTVVVPGYRGARGMTALEEIAENWGNRSPSRQSSFEEPSERVVLSEPWFTGLSALAHTEESEEEEDTEELWVKFKNLFRWRTFTECYQGATARVSGWGEAMNDCECSFEIDEEDCPTQPVALKQFMLCLWRGLIIRCRYKDQLYGSSLLSGVFVTMGYRNKDQLYGSWLLSGVFVTLGITLTFYNVTAGQLRSLDDRCALLTVLPFSMVLLGGLWNEGDHEDRRIFAYERERGYYSSPVFSPLCSLLADILLYKLFPPMFASCTLYSLLGLKSTWRAWGRFVGALWLMQIAGACFCKAVFSFIGMFSAFVPVKAAMLCSFLLSLQILFTGLLVDLSFSRVKKELSIFYWGCNVLYWGELEDTVMASGMTGESLLETYGIVRIDPTHAFRVLCLHIAVYVFIVIVSSLFLHGDWRLSKRQKQRGKVIH